MDPNNIQSLYYACWRLANDQESLQGLLNEVETSQPGAFLPDLESKFRSLRYEDIGFRQKDYFVPRFITYTELFESPELSMGVFGMSNGCSFPIHDHPQMLGITFVLSGRIQYRNFDIVSREETFFNLAVSMEGQAKGQEILYLTGKKGNLHQIQALENSVILDVFIPSYSEVERPCTYYREIGPNRVETFIPGMRFRSLPYRGKPLF